MAGASATETPLVLACEGKSLLALLHQPAQLGIETGVVLVVGGPQYRVGSHRQFVLLARYLADQGIAVLRFDYRGMGDSEGEIRDFADVSRDIRVAVDALVEHQQGLSDVVIWGLCDAASAAAFYGWTDDRVSGLVLLNPWVRTDAGEARVYLKHYYLQRLMSRELWAKVLSLNFDAGRSLRSMMSLFGRARGASSGAGETQSSAVDQPLPERMLHGLSRFQGEVLLVLSGQDLVAREFEDLTSSSRPWKDWMSAPRLTLKRLPESDHTFSRRVWRDQVAELTREWLHR